MNTHKKLKFNKKLKNFKFKFKNKNINKKIPNASCVSRKKCKQVADNCCTLTRHFVKYTGTTCHQWHSSWKHTSTLSFPFACDSQRQSFGLWHTHAHNTQHTTQNTKHKNLREHLQQRKESQIKPTGKRKGRSAGVNTTRPSSWTAHWPVSSTSPHINQL